MSSLSPRSALPPARLTIATRESALALWQARHVQTQLQKLYPDCDVQLLGMTTQGDQILDRTLSKIGGKGLFVKELEQALADGRADLAVHSLKDVPVLMPEGFELAAIGVREDPRDALVSNRFQHLDELPDGAVVGTSSLRRESQLRQRFPHLRIEPLRGNVHTRLAKLDRGEFDAIVLAAAGLKRLDLAARITSLMSPDESLPAVGQGALGIEILSQRPELHAWLQPLHDPDTATRISAERTVSRLLGGSCQVPLGAYAELEQGTLWLRGLVATPDGRTVLRAESRTALDRDPQAQAVALGEQVAAALLAQGAGPIMAALSA